MLRERQLLSLERSSVRAKDRGLGRFSDLRKLPMGSGFVILGGAADHPDASFNYRARISTVVEDSAIAVTLDDVTTKSTGTPAKLNGLRLRDMTGIKVETVTADYTSDNILGIGVQANVNTGQVTAWTIGESGRQDHEIDPRIAVKLIYFGSRFAQTPVQLVHSD